MPTTLKQGEDFGARLTLSSGSWAGLSLVCVAVNPAGIQIEIPGVVAVGGASATFTKLGSITVGWALGMWKLDYWLVTGGGSRDWITDDTMNVTAPNGAPPSSP